MTKNKDGTFTLTLSAEAVALLRGITGNFVLKKGSATDFTNEIYNALSDGRCPMSAIGGRFIRDNRRFIRDNIELSLIKREDVTKAAIEYGYKQKPAAPKKLRMPDGKYAPANYRKIQYPEHGSGVLRERHILFGAISGNNVAVQEWNGKEWLPKTYTLSKIRG